MTGNNEENVLYGGDVELLIPLTLGELFLTLLKNHEDKIVQVDPDTGEELTARELLIRAIRIARWLQENGIKTGDVVSICSDNRIEFCVIPIAAFIIGATLAPLNPEYSTAEFLHALSLSRPKAIFTTQKALGKVESARGVHNSIQHIIVFGDYPPRGDGTITSFNHILQLRRLVSRDDEEFESPELDVNETIATILCSSGTTGLPKGVMTTQGNMVSYVSVLRQVMNFDLNQPSDDIMLGLVPFFHSMGLMTMLLALIGGRKLVVFRRFSVERLLKAVEKYKISVIAVPPPVLVLLSRSPLLDKYDISSLKEIRCGAAPLPRHYERLTAKRLKVSNVHQAYGMTETTLGVLFAPKEGAPLGSVGKLVPGMWAKVADEQGSALPTRAEGELWFKGPLIMKGYIGNTSATSAAIDSEGWLHTGDVGYYDENGFFYVVDRIKELVKYKGYQVPPAELEALLVAHKDVLDAAVVGTPDDAAGELPTAFVVIRPGSKITPKELQDYIKERVSSPKQLRGGVIFTDIIPRNPTGKILRRVLKQRAITIKSKL